MLAFRNIDRLMGATFGWLALFLLSVALCVRTVADAFAVHLAALNGGVA